MEFAPLFDLIGPLIAAILTVMVLSYLIGDNALFRFTMYLFIGVAGGYAGAVAWHNVLKPGLVDPLLTAFPTGLTDPALVITVLVPWFLIFLLVFKVSTATARIGAIPMALLVGVGAAVVVGGSITGTLIPQSLAAMDSLNPWLASPQTGAAGLERIGTVVILLLGTITTLLYFRFTVRRREPGASPRPLFVVYGVPIPDPMTILRFIGRGFITVTFGVMYAGALAATLIVMAERVQFLYDTFIGLLDGLGL